MEITSQYLMTNEGLNLLNNLFTSSGEGIMFIDAKGVILALNPRTEELFGYRDAELKGRKIEVLIPDQYRKEHVHNRDTYVKYPKARRMGGGRDLVGLRKDGQEFPLEASLSYFEHEGERIVVAFITDITLRKRQEAEIQLQQEALQMQAKELRQKVSERTKELEHMNLGLQSQIQERKMAEKALKRSLEDLKRAEGEIMQALEKERELNELKSRFVSMASHEFRTPLTTILSSANLIGKYSLEAEQDSREKHIGRIKNAVQNLTSILNDFLSLEKVETGKLEVRPEHLRTGHFVDDLLESIEQTWKKDQRLEVKVEDVEVFTDPHLMTNILLNLLSNARKYSDIGAVIYLSVTEVDHNIVWVVRDTGIGIPIDEQKQLFERFFRAKNATNIPGTGLGLNILRNYVEILNGQVTFESAEGKGTTFTVIIPKIYTLKE